MGTYIRLVDYKSSEEKECHFQTDINRYVSDSKKFSEIPGSPYAYWVSDSVRKDFSEDSFGAHFEIRAGICTGENETFIKNWYEMDYSLSSLCTEKYRYVPHNKGGEYRKWYGNRDYFLKYNEQDLKKMETKKGYRHDGKECYFKNHVGWSKITSSRYSFRLFDTNFTFDSAGLGLFSKDGKMDDLLWALGFLNSKIATYFINLLNPTLNVTPMVVKNLPMINSEEAKDIDAIVDENISMAKEEWDEFETSWEFKKHPLL